MTQHFRELISRYLDGTLTVEQQADLSKWLESDPGNADQFAEAVLLDNRLHAEVNAAPYKTPAGVDAVSMTHHSHRRVWLRIAAIVAACLMIGVGIIFLDSSPDEKQFATGDGTIDADPEFASVIQIVSVDWADNPGLRIGERLSHQTIRLSSGFVGLAFDDGVEVTLQGPVCYQLIGPGRTRLTEGLLTATVPPGAEGFTVDTPEAEIVDLGTSFGIDLREQGFSSVSVFEGEVEIAVPDATGKHLLTEGESVRIGENREIEAVDFDPTRFEKVWPVSSGIAGSTETFRFVPPWPKRIRFVRSDSDIFVAVEGHAVDLVKTLQVNVSEPGEYERVEDLTPVELTAGKRVRSYILHYMPESQIRPRRAKRISGSITFDRPVLGLIVAHDQLLASSRRFTRRAAGEAHRRRQLNLTGRLDGDRVTLSEDRRTVTVDLVSPGRSSDLVRVIVDATVAPASGPEQEANP